VGCPIMGFVKRVFYLPEKIPFLQELQEVYIFICTKKYFIWIG